MIERIEADGQLDTMAELELVIHAFEKAVSTPQARFSRTMWETSLSGSRMFPNLRDPVGQTSRQAGYCPLRVRWMQKWHFSMTP